MGKSRGRHVETQIPQEDLREHPAFLAWSRLNPERLAVACIHVLRERRSANIYRLDGVGAGGASVIAKCHPSSRAAIERTIYEEILPHLPVTAPRYYGSSESDEGRCWLFLEDVGRERYSISDAEHLALAGRWLGRMHTSAARDGLPKRLRERLPRGGPARYLDHLRAGRANIVGNLGNIVITAPQVVVLEAIVALHDRLESVWDRVEEACAEVPSTLAHGDFRPKNAYVRSEPTGLELYPIDWEMASWGTPTADFARVDVAAYRSVTREVWPGLDERCLETQAALAQVFRFLAAIDWDSPELARETPELLSRPLSSLRVFRGELTDAMRAAGLLDEKPW